MAETAEEIKKAWQYAYDDARKHYKSAKDYFKQKDYERCSVSIEISRGNMTLMEHLQEEYPENDFYKNKFAQVNQVLKNETAGKN